MRVTTNLIYNQNFKKYGLQTKGNFGRYSATIATGKKLLRPSAEYATPKLTWFCKLLLI